MSGSLPSVIHLGLPPLALMTPRCTARIGVAGLGVFLLFNLGMRGQPIGDGVGRNLSLIHLEEGDLAAVGRPEVIAAHAEFFGVDPVHFAIQDVFVGVVGERLRLLPRNGLDIEVVLADVRDAVAVG